MTLPLSPHMCPPARTLFPRNKHFTYFTTSHFFCVGIHFYKASGPVPHHWPLTLLVWWLVFSALGLTLVSGVPDFRLWYQNPASRHCRPRPTKLRTAVVFQEVKKKESGSLLVHGFPGLRRVPTRGLKPTRVGYLGLLRPCILTQQSFM